MEVWVPLLSALVGGLIAVVPVLITLRNQSVEREKDRQEQRREAKTQLALDLEKNDIKILEDVIDNTLKIMDLVHLRSFSKMDGLLTEKDVRQEFFSIDGSYYRLGESVLIGDKLARTFGEDIYGEYELFSNLATEYVSIYLYEDVTLSGSKCSELKSRAVASAAELHNMLKDKLISIRDS